MESVESRFWITLGSILAALAVALGALGAHGLGGFLATRGLAPDEVADRLETFETAVRYHMYHALALVLVGLIGSAGAGRWSTSLTLAAGCLLLGVLLFSGCLYAYVFTGVKWLGAIVPIGGVAFIVGWLILAWAALRQR